MGRLVARRVRNLVRGALIDIIKRANLFSKRVMVMIKSIRLAGAQTCDVPNDVGASTNLASSSLSLMNLWTCQSASFEVIFVPYLGIKALEVFRLHVQ